MRRRHHRTRRLVLRPYTRRDWRAWRDGYAGQLPAQDRWDLGPLPIEHCSESIFRRMLVRHADMARRDTTYVYGVFVRRSGIPIGVIDLHVLCRQDRQLGNLGYRIHNRHRRRGYGAEAARAALELGFTALGLNRIEAVVDPDNAASIALAQAIGMRGGELEEGYLFEDGKWVDQVVFRAAPPDLGLPRTTPLELGEGG